MAKQKKEKDPFKDLDDEFKNEVSSRDREELKQLVSKIALGQAELMEAKEQDQDLKDKKEEYQTANFQYAEGTKTNRLKIKFIRQTLKGMGAL